MPSMWWALNQRAAEPLVVAPQRARRFDVGSAEVQIALGEGNLDPGLIELAVDEYRQVAERSHPALMALGEDPQLEVERITTSSDATNMWRRFATSIIESTFVGRVKERLHKYLACSARVVLLRGQSMHCPDPGFFRLCFIAEPTDVVLAAVDRIDNVLRREDSPTV